MQVDPILRRRCDHASERADLHEQRSGVLVPAIAHRLGRGLQGRRTREQGLAGAQPMADPLRGGDVATLGDSPMKLLSCTRAQPGSDGIAQQRVAKDITARLRAEHRQIDEQFEGALHLPVEFMETGLPICVGQQGMDHRRSRWLREHRHQLEYSQVTLAELVQQGCEHLVRRVLFRTVFAFGHENQSLRGCGYPPCPQPSLHRGDDPTGQTLRLTHQCVEKLWRWVTAQERACEPGDLLRPQRLQVDPEQPAVPAFLVHRQQIGADVL